MPTVDTEEQVKPRRSAGRKASISEEELFAATLRLIGSEKSIAKLSLREIAREAGIAPNSFYRHFKDVDALAVALIERAGGVLRQIIGAARKQAQTQQDSVVRGSVAVFLQELDNDDGYLSLLLREGYTGSPAYKQAVEKQLQFFIQELAEDLVKLEALRQFELKYPEILAKAITQLVFNMGASVVDLPKAQRNQIADETLIMIRMLIIGARNG